MAKSWQTLVARYAALKRREKWLVVFACLALPYVLIDTALVSPTLVKQRRLTLELAQKQADSAKLSAQLAVIKSQGLQDPDAQNRKRLAELQEKFADLQAKVKEQSALIVPADKMSAVLERMLANHPRLELVELKTLPQVALELGADAKAPAATAPAPAGTEAATERSIYKHGLQVSIRGSYLELLDYLRSLESLPGRLYWENMELSVDEYPAATLKLTLYTISFDKAWMKV